MKTRPPYEAGDFIEMVSATKVEDPSAADVRVMNIHQSKGLQFDIVVLPELDGRLSGLTPRGRRRPQKSHRPHRGRLPLYPRQGHAAVAFAV